MSQDGLSDEVNDAQKCPICINSESYTEMYSLPCSHTFHKICIDQWLEKKYECPVCRLNLDHIPDEGNNASGCSDQNASSFFNMFPMVRGTYRRLSQTSIENIIQVIPNVTLDSSHDGDRVDSNNSEESDDSDNRLEREFYNISDGELSGESEHSNVSSNRGAESNQESSEDATASDSSSDETSRSTSSNTSESCDENNSSENSCESNESCEDSSECSDNSDSCDEYSD